MNIIESFSQLPAVLSLDAATVRRRITRRRVVAVAGAALAVPLLWASTVLVVNLIRDGQRRQCAVHLKTLGSALYQYHEAHGHLPAPARRGRDGRPHLSWRVTLLPHLGYRSLYERFHQDEPWDSPHNRALLSEMPREFACPGAPLRQRGLTGYSVVVGPETEPTSVNTPFEPARGVDLREITDGPSNTIVVLETSTLVPWTKPDDLRWAQNEAPPRLSSGHRGGTHVLFADGAVRFLKNTLGRTILQALLTINGGELTGG